MNAPPQSQVRDLGLVRRVRDEDDDEEIQKPLEWSLIRRLFTYAAPVKKKLTALSANERQQLCQYMVEAEGGVHSKTCSDGLTISVKSAADCVSGLTAFKSTCTATVDNAEACAEAAGDDLCNLVSSPSCTFLFQCAQ